MLGFGDVGLPAVEVGDEVVLVDVLGGIGEAAFVADLDGFQIAREVLKLLVRCGGQKIGGNETGHILFEAGVALGQGEEFGTKIVDLGEERLHAMSDGGEIAADGFAESEEAFLSEREDGLQAEHESEDVLVGLLREV